MIIRGGFCLDGASLLLMILLQLSILFIGGFFLSGIFDSKFDFLFAFIRHFFVWILVIWAIKSNLISKKALIWGALFFLVAISPGLIAGSSNPAEGSAAYYSLVFSFGSALLAPSSRSTADISFSFSFLIGVTVLTSVILMFSFYGCDSIEYSKVGCNGGVFYRLTSPVMQPNFAATAFAAIFVGLSAQKVFAPVLRWALVYLVTVILVATAIGLTASRAVVIGVALYSCVLLLSQLSLKHFICFSGALLALGIAFNERGGGIDGMMAEQATGRLAFFKEEFEEVVAGSSISSKSINGRESVAIDLLSFQAGEATNTYYNLSRLLNWQAELRETGDFALLALYRNLGLMGMFVIAFVWLSPFYRWYRLPINYPNKTTLLFNLIAGSVLIGCASMGQVLFDSWLLVLMVGIICVGPVNYAYFRSHKIE